MRHIPSIIDIVLPASTAALKGEPLFKKRGYFVSQSTSLEVSRPDYNHRILPKPKLVNVVHRRVISPLALRLVILILQIVKKATGNRR
jgi:hypothetical protein